MLDYAELKYGKEFVSDVKVLRDVSYMFLPFPLFWALFDQQVIIVRHNFILCFI